MELILRWWRHNIHNVGETVVYKNNISVLFEV
jgi:hypothetical protein